MTEGRRKRGPSLQKTAETQARIVNSALTRFLAEGFERTRMLDVAQDAGLAKGTLYLYFPTKEALFEGVVTQMLGEAVERIVVAQPASNDSMHDFVLRALTPMFTDEQAGLRQALLWLILTEGQRFPEVLKAYRRVALDPILAAARKIGAKAHSQREMASDALERFPVLMLAPGVVASVWNNLFPTEAIDAQSLLHAYVDLVFRQESSGE